MTRMVGLRLRAVSSIAVLTIMAITSVLAPCADGSGAPTASVSASDDSGKWSSGPYPYRDFATVVATLEETAAEHPDICSLVDIGDGWEKTVGKADRDVLAMRITDNPDLEEDEPDALIMARQHASEATPTEIALQLIENLTDLYGSDARVSWLVDNRDIWIIPVVNPDGMDYSMSEDVVWRKNRHLNYDGSYGVDLNRNYNGSENGDPLGAWGVAGTSSDPSNSDYCGEYAFSEPETQAVRDLALNQGFEVAADFHMSGDGIAWPWGYTTEPTPDDAELSHIADEMSKLNGYFTLLSADMGLTTGDSLDWLYGGADAYPFLFEVGGWDDINHAEDEYDIVLGQIEENIAPSLLLIEMAGDRADKRFEVIHVPIDDSAYSDAGFEVSVKVRAERGADLSGQLLRFRVDGGSWNELAMSPLNSLDTFVASIPPQAASSLVEYYIVSHDNGGVERMSPLYAPYEVYSFNVT